MKFNWLILCEGFGTGAQGALTAIGLNQNVLIAHGGVPTTTKRAVIGHLTGDDHLKEGDQIGFNVKVYAPNERVVQEQEGFLKIRAGSPWHGLSRSLDLPLELMLTLSTLGTYRIAVTVRPPGGAEMEEVVDFHVVTPQQQAGAGSAPDEGSSPS